MVDVKVAREAYKEGIIDDIICIWRKCNLADAMTEKAIPLEFIEPLHKNYPHY